MSHEYFLNKSQMRADLNGLSLNQYFGKITSLNLNINHLNKCLGYHRLKNDSKGYNQTKKEIKKLETQLKKLRGVK